MRDYLKEKSRLIQVNPLVWVAHIQIHNTLKIRYLGNDTFGGKSCSKVMKSCRKGQLFDKLFNGLRTKVGSNIQQLLKE
jgi:hypothetical protein